MNPRQPQPQHQYHPQKRQNNRLQNLHALRLRDRAHRERKNRCTRPAKRGRKPNRRDVQMAGQELSSSDDGGREKRPEKEALQGDGDG